MRLVNYLITAIFAAGMLAGCSPVSYPAITTEATNTYRYGDIVWRDLVTTDAAAVSSFYSGLFGWEITQTHDGDIDYYTINNNGRMIGGIIHPEGRSADKGSEWVSMLSVQSVENTTENVKAYGGDVYGSEFTVQGRGEVALITDPSKAFIGLIHAADGDPAALELNEGDWLWTELWTDDPEGVTPFYEAFGLRVSKEVKGGNDYYILKAGDEIVASMMKNPIENWRSQWVPYVRVEDAGATSAKAGSLGGKVVMEPNQQVRDGSVAVVMDPAGAIVVLQEWTTSN